jgi:hypothetical protein
LDLLVTGAMAIFVGVLFAWWGFGGARVDGAIAITGRMRVVVRPSYKLTMGSAARKKKRILPI